MYSSESLAQTNLPCFPELAYSYDPRALALLNRLRFQAISCRAAKHLSFEEACQLIQSDTNLEVENHISALVRILDQALERRTVVHAPRSATLSFDEKWLLQIFEQALRKDHSSLLFLTRSRVSRYKQRSFASLCLRLVAAFEE